MAEVLAPEVFLERRDRFLLFDVRSPGEYAAGHIPGAHSLPLFTDDERARVGTCYKQKGRDPAVLLGLELVGPKLASFVSTARALHDGEKTLGLYCARGGARSSSMAWLLETAGFQVSLLRGGYKSFRAALRTSFARPHTIVILSGHTGSGKTRVLTEMAGRGEQVLDLEALAQHRGSAFGGFEQPQDLTNETFWNRIYDVWSRLDPSRRVWIEDESRNLGRVEVPPDLFRQMREAPVMLMVVPQAARVQLLLEDYAQLSGPFLENSVERIARRLGPDNTRACRAALEEGRFRDVARLCLDYYDRAYEHGLSKRDRSTIQRVELRGTDAASNADILLSTVGDQRVAS